MEQIAITPVAYWLIGLSFTIGVIVGLWVSAHQNPLSGPAIMEGIKKRRIEVEMIYNRWCKIRAHKTEPEDYHEQYIRDCSTKNFANRVYRLYQNYEEEMRGGQRYRQILSSSSNFDLDYTNDPRRLEAEVHYHRDPTPPNEWE